MARAYSSALPVFSTYTPGVAPAGVAAPVNHDSRQARTVQGRPAALRSNGRGMAQQAQMAAAAVRGTGAGERVVAGMRHTPLTNALASASSDRGRGWSQTQRDPRQTPVGNPAAVAEAHATRDSMNEVAAAVIASPNFGTTTGSREKVGGYTFVRPGSSGGLILPQTRK